MTDFLSSVQRYLYWLSIPDMEIKDIIDILIVSFIVYEVIKWIKSTRAWTLLKGILLIGFIAIAAYVFQLHALSWLINNTLSVGVMAAIIVFQPELRRALEQLGRKNIFVNLFSVDDARVEEPGYSDRTIQEIVRATIEMSKVKTGALMVLQKEVSLGEYERTGIPVDGRVSSQLLINIFEHNTPLHDGAVIIYNNRVASATCYLPLSDSLELGKELGTRHRAGVGISEVSDSITVIVSEETGGISIAQGGSLKKDLTPQQLREELSTLKDAASDNKKFKVWKGLSRNERKNTK